MAIITFCYSTFFCFSFDCCLSGDIVDSLLNGCEKMCLMFPLLIKFSECFAALTLADLLCPEWNCELARDFLLILEVVFAFTRSFVTVMFSFGYFFRFFFCVSLFLTLLKSN